MLAPAVVTPSEAPPVALKDVYKRQSQDQSSKNPNLRLKFLFPYTAEGTEAVSYTHLDVYKRQTERPPFPSPPAAPGSPFSPS